MRTPSLLSVLALPLAGCAAETLSQSWQLDRLRVLAIQAEPAEPRPGDTVTFRSLVYTPEGLELEGSIWFACLPQDATDFGCELDPTIVDSLSGTDFEDLSPEELAALYAQAQEAGLIGFEPLLPPSWVAPEAALDGLEGNDRLEGRSAIINVSALPVGAEDDGDIEVVYKRVPVSEATTPNHNPVLMGFLVDGVEVASGDRVSLSRGSTHELEPLLSDDSIETYDYLGSDGQTEERSEEPYFDWYVEDGSFLQNFSLFPYSSTEWTPGDAAEVELKVVIRDRRGGMDWGELTLVME